MDEIYKEKILEHHKNPKNNKPIIMPSHEHEEKNPLCGDIIKIHLRIQGNKITEIGWSGKGCVLSTATTSILTEHIKNKTHKEIHELTIDEVKDIIQINVPKTRIGCIALPLKTIKKALEKQGK